MALLGDELTSLYGSKGKFFFDFRPRASSDSHPTAESAASRRDVEQEQELNRLEEVRARRELQQDIAALQAK